MRFRFGALLAAMLFILAGAVVAAWQIQPYSVFTTGAHEKTEGAGDTDSARAQPEVKTIWFSDFSGDRVGAFTMAGKIVWTQHMGSPPIPSSSYATNTEYVTVAPNGNLIVVDGDGMVVQEIDRATHRLLWQFGVKDKQGYADGLLHQPDKSWKLNDHEVLINDGNNRRVIIVDQRTDEIIWQYGETLKMGSKPGYLRGNTSVVPLEENTQFLITDTLEKKIILVDRATKTILWEWVKPDAKWLEHVFPTARGTFILEDRQKNEVFEVDRHGNILWTLTHYADGSAVQYPSDTAELPNGHVLIAEAGRNRIVEVNPRTKEIVKTFTGAGFITTIALDEREIPSP